MYDMLGPKAVERVVQERIKVTEMFLVDGGVPKSAAIASNILFLTHVTNQVFAGSRYLVTRN